MVQSLLGKFCIISPWLFSSFCVNSLRLDDAFIVLNYDIIGAANGVSPVQHQAISWINIHQLSAGLGQLQQMSVKFETLKKNKKMLMKTCQQNVVHFVQASMCSLSWQFKKKEIIMTKIGHILTVCQEFAIFSIVSGHLSHFRIHCSSVDIRVVPLSILWCLVEPAPGWTLHINSLCPSGARWWHKCGTTLTQVMAWCLRVPSHYLNQCWLLISQL